MFYWEIGFHFRSSPQSCMSSFAPSALQFHVCYIAILTELWTFCTDDRNLKDLPVSSPADALPLHEPLRKLSVSRLCVDNGRVHKLSAFISSQRSGTDQHNPRIRSLGVRKVA